MVAPVNSTNSTRRLPITHGAPRKNGVSIRTLVGCFALSLCSFYAGLLLGFQSNAKCPPCSGGKQASNEPTVSIPSTMKNLITGVARVDRDAFFDRFDVGVPKDVTKPGNEEVLMVYSHENALPTGVAGDGDFPNLSVEKATEHCNTLKIVYTEPRKKNECVALVGQWESYHVQKYMRLPPNKDRKVEVNLKHELRPVSRLHGDKGLQQQIPWPTNVKQYDAILIKYLSSLDSVLKELTPVAEKVARDNTIIVMVCNYGQSELLLNFACSSRARGFDLSQILVFATDLETKALAEGLGLTAFYDHTNFEELPSDAAKFYADKAFQGMMMAKVYCVHMINRLGYDLLFQDVDMVWYRNPLDYFTNTSSPIYNFDVYFQDDGAHSKRYAPYSPNSGFYFVRHNERTEYFLHMLLMNGNIIAQTGSHQNAMAGVLNEHASWRGLRVKTLERDSILWLGGFHYHMRKEMMKQMIQGKVQPYIFHMSWTANKDNKRLFFEQMGDWYVQDECVGAKPDSIKNGIVQTCCSAEPIMRCHYRDKPSKIPCKNSPPIDAGHRSWW